MSTKTAEGCFLENGKLYCNPKTEPEKSNLYDGLAKLAGSISDLQDEVHKIYQELSLLRASLGK